MSRLPLTRAYPQFILQLRIVTDLLKIRPNLLLKILLSRIVRNPRQ